MISKDEVVFSIVKEIINKYLVNKKDVGTKGKAIIETLLNELYKHESNPIFILNTFSFEKADPNWCLKLYLKLINTGTGAPSAKIAAIQLYRALFGRGEGLKTQKEKIEAMIEKHMQVNIK